MSWSLRESLEGAARPSSLLLQNRRERPSTAAGTDAFDVLSRSGRRPFIIPSAASPAAEDDKEKEKDKGGANAHPFLSQNALRTASMQLESSEPPQGGADNLLSLANLDAQKHEYDWLLTPPETPHRCFLDDRDPQVAVELKNNPSPQSVSEINSSKLRVPQSENGQPTKPMRSKSVACSSISTNPNKTSVPNTNVASATSRRPSTPNRLPASTRPSTPNRLPASTRPSTPDRPSVPTRPSTPNRLTGPNRPSTPNRSSAPTRPMTPNRSSAPTRPSTPNRPSAPTRPSTPSRPSAPTRPSTPNRPSAPLRPSTPNRPSATVRSPTPTKASTPSTACRASTPIRPSTPSRRATSNSNTNKQAATPARPVTSRQSTPRKPRPLTTSGDHQSHHHPHSSRSSTPSSHPRAPETAHSQVHAGSNRKSNPVTSCSNGRTSTPTRRMPAPFSTPITSRATSTGRRSSIKNSSTLNQANSPEPKASTKLIVPPDSPLDVPSNLQTKLPERPASASRTRPGAKLTARTSHNSEPSPPTKPTRRQSPSPVASRGRSCNNSPNTRNRTEMQKTAMDGTTKRPSKTASAVESNGLGRTLTKKSLDMALKKMDIRKGAGGIRSASLFPHSIRTGTLASSPSLSSSGLLTPTSSNETDTEDTSWNDTTSGSISIHDGVSECGESVVSPYGEVLVARVKEPNLNESYGFGAALLKQESKDLHWLHSNEASTDLLKADPKDTEWLLSVESGADQRPIFENQFEQLPEPFNLT